MAQARYTVQRPFEHEGAKMKLGYIMILDTEIAQPLLEKGYLRFDKYLDPHDPKDGAEIDFFRDNPAGKRHAKPAPVAAPSAPLPPEEEEEAPPETTGEQVGELDKEGNVVEPTAPVEESTSPKKPKGK